MSKPEIIERETMKPALMNLSPDFIGQCESNDRGGHLGSGAPPSQKRTTKNTHPNENIFLSHELGLAS